MFPPRFIPSAFVALPISPEPQWLLVALTSLGRVFFTILGLWLESSPYLLQFVLYFFPSSTIFPILQFVFDLRGEGVG